MISFFVSCLPIAQPRQRHRLVTTKSGRQFTTNYTPAKHPVNAFKAAVQLAAKNATAMRLGVLTGPVLLELRFILPRPMNHFGTGRNAGRLKNSAPSWHTSRPDLENIEKAFLDALTGICWRDDSQVCQKISSKVYGEEIGVEAVITEVESNSFFERTSNDRNQNPTQIPSPSQTKQGT